MIEEQAFTTCTQFGFSRRAVFLRGPIDKPTQTRIYEVYSRIYIHEHEIAVLSEQNTDAAFTHLKYSMKEALGKLIDIFSH